jgi:hypothetical protein
MTRRDGLLLTTWAGGAFGLAMALMLPANLSAGGKPTTAPVIDRPTLNVNGADLSVLTTPDGGAQLVAVNNGPNQVQLAYAMQVQSQSPPRPDSRVALPRTLYRNAQNTLALKPGETRVVPIEGTIRPNGEVSVNLAANGQRLTAKVAAKTR